MLAQYRLRRVLFGLLAAAAFTPGAGAAQPGHDAPAAAPWRYVASAEGHIPALPQRLRDAARGGGTIEIEVALFDFASLAFEATFDPVESRWGLSADIAGPGASTGPGRGTHEDREEAGPGLPDDLPSFWGVYFGSRSWLARFHAPLRSGSAGLFKRLGGTTPALFSFSPNLH